MFIGWEMVIYKKHPTYQILGLMPLIGQAHILLIQVKVQICLFDMFTSA